MIIDGEEDETLDLTPDMEVEGEAQDGAEAKAAEEPEGFDIEIEGEETSEDTPLTKHLRAELERRNARIKDLQERTAAPAKIEVGAEPTLEGCDWDEDRFKSQWTAWHDRKTAAERQASQEAEQTQQRNRVFEKAFGAYKAKAAAMGVSDFEAIEKTVIETLPQQVQGAIVQYMDDPAKVVYALGKYPATLAKIAAEPDPLRQILMIRDMEKKIVPKKKAPPPPEAASIQRGSAPIAGSTDKKLLALEEKARKTGDRTELIRYKADLRKKAA